MRRFAYLLAGAVAAVGLAFGAVPASASTGTFVPTTDGDAGYIATGLGLVYGQAEVTFTITNAMKAIGVTPETAAGLADPKGAVGTGLCNSGTRTAAEVGALYNGTTFFIADSVGSLNANGGDDCVNNGILTNGSIVHPLLGSLPVGESVTVEVVEFARGDAFYVSDNTTGQSFSQYVSFRTVRVIPGHWGPCFHGPGGKRVCIWIHKKTIVTFPHAFYNEALFGAMADPTLLGGGTPSDLVDFTGVEANNVNPDNGGTSVRPVYSSGDASQPWLIGPNGDTHGGSPTFSCALNVTTPPVTATFLTTTLPFVPGAFSICSDAGVGA
jgi:hypothetical protein